jgi:hypothetical protein
MSRSTYLKVVTILVFGDGVVHVIRLLIAWATAYTIPIPLWVSPIAVLVYGGLGLYGLQLIARVRR